MPAQIPVMSPTSPSPARAATGQVSNQADITTAREPVPIAIRPRQPQRAGADVRFGPSDPPRGWDITASPRVARLVRDRRFQFLLILPNQIIFWTVRNIAENAAAFAERLVTVAWPGRGMPCS